MFVCDSLGRRAPTWDGYRVHNWLDGPHHQSIDGHGPHHGQREVADSRALLHSRPDTWRDFHSSQVAVDLRPSWGLVPGVRRLFN